MIRAISRNPIDATGKRFLPGQDDLGRMPSEYRPIASRVEGLALIPALLSSFKIDAVLPRPADAPVYVTLENMGGKGLGLLHVYHTTFSLGTPYHALDT